MKLMRGLRDRSKRDPSAPRADFFAGAKKKKTRLPASVGMTVGCLMAVRCSLSYAALVTCGCVLVTLAGCSHTAKADRSTVTLLIESNPTNLDPRFATDGQSQHLDGLIFSSLVERDEQMNLRGDLAESWDALDALTYVFHLRPGVRFHDGSAVTAADVKATFDFILNAANRSPKRGAFRMIAYVEAPDARTVIFHLKDAYASFLWSVSRPAIGIVPAGAGADFSQTIDRIGAVPVREPGAG